MPPITYCVFCLFCSYLLPLVQCTTSQKTYCQIRSRELRCSTSNNIFYSIDIDIASTVQVPTRKSSRAVQLTPKRQQMDGQDDRLIERRCTMSSKHAELTASQFDTQPLARIDHAAALSVSQSQTSARGAELTRTPRRGGSVGRWCLDERTSRGRRQGAGVLGRLGSGLSAHPRVARHRWAEDERKAASPQSQRRVSPGQILLVLVA